MRTIRANQTTLAYELAGSTGEPVVLVHGSWADHTAWTLVAPLLAQSFRVLTYDRRGHGVSTQPATSGSRAQDEADLGALIDVLDLAPAHVVGNSFGASIALGLATARPDLVASVSAHEPPLLSVIGDDPEMAPLLDDQHARIGSVVEQLQRGDVAAGAREFIDTVAFGPGAWDTLPADVQQVITANALTFVDEMHDPHWADIDLAVLSRLRPPALLTQGDQSMPWYGRITAALQRAMPPSARVHTFRGAGHAPHGTHPEQFAQVTADFIRGVR